MSIISGINIYSPLHGYSSARQAYSPPEIQAQRAQCQDDVQLSLEALERYDAEIAAKKMPARIDMPCGNQIINIAGTIEQNLELIAERIQEILGDGERDPFYLVMSGDTARVLGDEKAAVNLFDMLDSDEPVFRDQTIRSLVSETLQYTKFLLFVAHNYEHPDPAQEERSITAIFDFLKSMGFPDPENNPDPEFADMALKFSGNRLSLDLLDREERETLANGGSLA
ncbi:hypothetical protein LGV61_03385 [Desulfurispirillum indicum]|uniref:Uncharacterized protein n=1 Tax=Desulfurispirillum indicum (strain ATCC BAA-1389 / DSM 22839 / S5) TaxID=653733 RepID=E6W1G3_DESIS|nr:hypothetical protein [Desulfurispirillum indicum]ADU65419.1 hypothetical protein Selin_0674 [Desulfurispirillum indicum S5]UCZ57336.1 hypothetical protein LGV61_03385 [Desulfurispirillum indicum]